MSDDDIPEPTVTPSGDMVAIGDTASYAIIPATFNTPAGWSQRCTMRDDSAPHQIRITAPGASFLLVSCTCRSHLDPLGTIQTCEQAWAVWNSYHREMIR